MKLFKWDWKGNFKLDLKKGPALGIDTSYAS